MENLCNSKESMQFADDTQLENTAKMMKGFKWIQNDPDMLDKTWKIEEWKKQSWMTSPKQNFSAAQIPNEEQLARREFCKGTTQGF